MCLNHKLPGIEGIYDVHTYFDERKQALTQWADYLIAIEALSAGVQAGEQALLEAA
jgi:hypothetical protein